MAIPEDCPRGLSKRTVVGATPGCATAATGTAGAARCAADVCSQRRAPAPPYHPLAGQSRGIGRPELTGPPNRDASTVCPTHRPSTPPPPLLASSGSPRTPVVLYPTPRSSRSMLPPKLQSDPPSSVVATSGNCVASGRANSEQVGMCFWAGPLSAYGALPDAPGCCGRPLLDAGTRDPADQATSPAPCPPGRLVITPRLLPMPSPLWRKGGGKKSSRGWAQSCPGGRCRPGASRLSVDRGPHLCPFCIHRHDSRLFSQPPGLPLCREAARSIIVLHSRRRGRPVPARSTDWRHCKKWGGPKDPVMVDARAGGQYVTI